MPLILCFCRTGSNMRNKSSLRTMAKVACKRYAVRWRCFLRDVFLPLFSLPWHHETLPNPTLSTQQTFARHHQLLFIELTGCSCDHAACSKAVRGALHEAAALVSWPCHPRLNRARNAMHVACIRVSCFMPSSVTLVHALTCMVACDRDDVGDQPSSYKIKLFCSRASAMC